MNLEKMLKKIQCKIRKNKKIIFLKGNEYDFAKLVNKKNFVTNSKKFYFKNPNL